ncbi:MAG: hypothetical protein GXY36_06615 [Chloroflexi bacterium]|jgi:hypothetical protein|nr:hypothetical protein [Chloroflexota bacterium]
MTRDTERDFILYGRPNDEKTQRMRQYLEDRAMPFHFVNIDDNPDDEKFLVLVNSGEVIMPTLVMGPDDDKLILSDPSTEEVDRALTRLGFPDPRHNLDGRDGDPRRF